MPIICLIKKRSYVLGRWEYFSQFILHQKSMDYSSIVHVTKGWCNFKKRFMIVYILYILIQHFMMILKILGEDYWHEFDNETNYLTLLWFLGFFLTTDDILEVDDTWQQFFCRQLCSQCRQLFKNPSPFLRNCRQICRHCRQEKP